MKTSKLIKFVSFILVVAMAANVLLVPISTAYAEGTIQSQQITLDDMSKAKKVNEKAEYVSTDDEKYTELVDKRTEYLKYYQLESKRYEAVTFGLPVHYFEDGEYKDIDNSLELVIDKNGKEKYVNKANSFKAEISPSIDDDWTASITKDDYKISWSIDGITKGTSASAKTFLTKDKWKQLKNGERRRNLPNISSEVIYKNVLQGIDLQYVVISDRIKENIILNSKKNISQITQRLETEGLTLSKQDDGSILASDSDTNKPVFNIQAPFMMDSQGNGCNISTDLVESDGIYILTYNLDQEWLDNAAYPVVVDPTITTSLDPLDIDDTRISSGLPTTNYTSSYIMCTGYGSTSKINYSLVKFNNMPEIGPSEMVVYAGFRVKKASSSTINSTITAHEITSSWDTTTVTWNTKPTFNSNIEDYCVVDTPAGKTWDWDITRIAKNWYSGSANNGILLKDVSDTGGYKEWYTTNATYGDVPYAYFVYTNYAGLEGYWDYASSSIGRGGSANVNLYNGNMVYTHSDLEMNGNRMPVAIAHVFNSTTRNDNDTSMLYGKGWRTNFDQRVEYVTIAETNYYAYTDEDGTVHYFVLKDGEWKAEDGIDLKLTVGGSNEITIMDKTDNKLVFYPVADPNKPGFLNYVEDNNGNRQTVGYDGNHRINKITDGAGRIILLTRDANGYLDKIRQPIDATNYRETVFIYDANDRLKEIQYPDSNSTTFTYDANGNMTSATNFDGKKTTITYQSAAPYRVTQLEESNGATMGGCLDYDYGYNRTEITDVDGRKAQYQFNDNGNTVCVIGPDGSATYSKFGTTANGATTNDINKIILSSKQQKFSVNYLLNHNMESSASWTLNSYSGSVGTHTYATDQKYYGAESIKLTKSNSTGYEAAIQNLTLEKGKTYTLSGHLKTSSVSGTYGAYMRVLYNTASGVAYVDTPAVFGTKDWTRYSTTFTIPSDASSDSVSVYLLLKESTGTAWFDSIQFEEGLVANRYNLIENADFTSYSGNTPSFWVRDNLTASDTVVTSADSTNPSYMSDTRFMINGDCTPGNWKSIDQTVPVSGNAGDSYVVGGWGKGTSVPMAKDTTFRVFGLSVQFKYTDGTSEYLVVHFNEDSSIWQYASGAVVAAKDYNSVVVRPHYSGEANTAWFDGIQLYREEFGQAFSYDADGNIKSATDLAENRSAFDFDANNDLIKVTTPKGNDFDYTYDSNHNVDTAETAKGIDYDFGYDTYGNNTVSKVYDASGTNTGFIKADAAYDANGNYINTVTDARGKVTDFDFNTNKGTLTQVEDASGNVVCYSYDSDLDRLSYVWLDLDQDGVWDTGEPKNTYTYVGDRLDKVTVNGFDYDFDYDSLGNLDIVKVGTQTLIDNDYVARKGLIDDSTYGNGDTVDYVYDDIDRVSQLNYDGSTTEFEYFYDSNGMLGYMVDNENGIEYRYVYDIADRLGRVERDNGITSWYIYDDDLSSATTTEYFYESIDANNDTYETEYNSDEDSRPTSTIISVDGGTEYKVTYDYDYLSRPTSTKYYTSTTQEYKEEYTYLTGGQGANSTTTLISQIEYNDTDTLSYTYDDVGNISTISDGTNVIQYYYDELNQLERENNPFLGTSGLTILYTYDDFGNIDNKKEYSITAGTTTPTTLLDTITYTYDSTWDDKLSSYDGNSITYDNIGNPLTYNDWTYTWKWGRRLDTASNGTVSTSYKYNDSGIRTYKQVTDGSGTTTFNYNLMDSTITYEERTGANACELYYAYNSTGKLYGFYYDGSSNDGFYYYQRNLQGDVIAILDSTGVEKVAYEYDSWGKLESITGTFASTIGADNPFRYRGYYYDTETGLYYLNQRYYNPEWGRFINADTLIGQQGDLLGHNLFTYCQNNPVMMYDPSGCGGIFSMLDSLLSGNEGGFLGALFSTAVVVTAVVVVGALTGGVGAVAIAGAVAGFAGSVGGQAIEDAVNGEPITIDYGEAVIDGIYGAAGGAAGQAMFGAASNAVSFLGSSLTVGVVADGYDYLTDKVIDKYSNPTQSNSHTQSTTNKTTTTTIKRSPNKTTFKRKPTQRHSKRYGRYLIGSGGRFIEF